jgi:hypothetical protein
MLPAERQLEKLPPDAPWTAVRLSIAMGTVRLPGSVT